jgi:hypothetical protein
MVLTDMTLFGHSHIPHYTIKQTSHYIGVHNDTIILHIHKYPTISSFLSHVEESEKRGIMQINKVDAFHLWESQQDGSHISKNKYK